MIPLHAFRCPDWINFSGKLNLRHTKRAYKGVTSLSGSGWTTDDLEDPWATVIVAEESISVHAPASVWIRNSSLDAGLEFAKQINSPIDTQQLLALGFERREQFTINPEPFDPDDVESEIDYQPCHPDQGVALIGNALTAGHRWPRYDRGRIAEVIVERGGIRIEAYSTTWRLDHDFRQAVDIARQLYKPLRMCQIRRFGFTHVACKLLSDLAKLTGRKISRL